MPHYDKELICSVLGSEQCRDTNRPGYIAMSFTEDALARLLYDLRLEIRQLWVLAGLEKSLRRAYFVDSNSDRVTGTHI